MMMISVLELALTVSPAVMPTETTVPLMGLVRLASVATAGPRSARPVPCRWRPGPTRSAGGCRVDAEAPVPTRCRVAAAAGAAAGARCRCCRCAVTGRRRLGGGARPSARCRECRSPCRCQSPCRCPPMPTPCRSTTRLSACASAVSSLDTVALVLRHLLLVGRDRLRGRPRTWPGRSVVLVLALVQSLLRLGQVRRLLLLVGRQCRLVLGQGVLVLGDVHSCPAEVPCRRAASSWWSWSSVRTSCVLPVDEVAAAWRADWLASSSTSFASSALTRRLRRGDRLAQRRRVQRAQRLARR